MKTLLFVLLICSSSLLHAGQFTVDKRFNIVAVELLEQLPKHAADRLLEAERKVLGWNFSFYIDYDKTWVHIAEVEVSRNKENATLTDVSVVVKERIVGLIKSKIKIHPALTVEWEGKLKEMLQSK
ncbi:MAG: hypothetical protein GKR92_02460 [Gammaproteobacteria bacterium]|nr:MAG: hypothetical protein GKR92_02460 [Gammaproteobacteria bacterium]